MPRFDRTGPLGYGPKTGRGLGTCGRGYRFYSSKNELDALELEKKMLEEELDVIREEIEELKKEMK